MKGSPERAHWAHGYLAALVDVLGLFTRDLTPEQTHEEAEDYSQKRAA